MELEATGARQGARVTQETKRLDASGKAWQVGDTCLVYYPVAMADDGKLDLVMAQTRGHNIDRNQITLKSSFIPSKATTDPETSAYIPDLLGQFSKIARLFWEGEREVAKREVLEKNWEGMPAAMKQSALEKVEFDYDMKNNPKAKRPAVSGIQRMRVTEALFVPVINDRPILEKAKHCNQSLSEARAGKISKLITDPKYGPQLKEDGTYEDFIEVQYTFTSAKNDKSEAGRADPQGVVPEYLMRRRYPEVWEEIQQMLTGLLPDVELIAKRNYSFRDVPETTIKQALTSFCIMNQHYLSYLSDEGMEILEQNASILPELRIKLSDPDVQLVVDKAMSKDSEPAAPTVDQLGIGKSQAPSIEQLLNGSVDTSVFTGAQKPDEAPEEEVMTDDEVDALNEISGAEITL
jgi:hypothetical protein